MLIFYFPWTCRETWSNRSYPLPSVSATSPSYPPSPSPPSYPPSLPPPYS